MRFSSWVALLQSWNRRPLRQRQALDRVAQRGRNGDWAVEFLEPRCLLSAGDAGAPTNTHLFDEEGFLSAPSSAPAFDIATSFLAANAARLGLGPSDLANPIVTSSYSDEGSGTSHIYLEQQLNGLGIEGAFLSINLTGRGEVINVGSSFVTGLSTLAADPAYAVAPGLTADQALADVTDDLGLPTGTPITVVTAGSDLAQSSVLRSDKMSKDPITAALNYSSTANGVRLAWHLNVQSLDHRHWYDVEADAQTGALLSVADWVDEFETYDAIPPSAESPDDGGRVILVNPANPIASPFGWHDTDGVPGAEYTDTRGNNVFAQEDIDDNDTGGMHPSGGSGLLFDFPLDLTQDPSTYRPAAITNLFSTINSLHDIHERYGFTEAAGNFQVTNYSGLGLGNDAVQADAQDGSGTDNANFATPPDGINPRMQQYVFDLTTPFRDSDLENGVITHEFGHGISNRLTGGPANSNALSALQCGGMGEGWSDFWAIMLTQHVGDTATQGRTLGPYLFGNPIDGAGVRTFGYSFDMVLDPHTFADYTNVSQEVHFAGEIWCSALWDMNWLLINKDGFDPDLESGYSPGGAGNKLALQLVMDALKLQPVDPSFIQARDAILLADRNLTGGQNQREIWTAFARRGLGFSASTSSSNSNRVTTANDLPPVLSNPGITGHTPNDSTATPVSSVTFTFSEAMDTTSFNVAADVVSFTGPGGTNLLPQITGFSWVNSTTLQLNFNAQNTQGNYSIVLGPQILSADNSSPLEQDADGNVGEATDDRYTATFQIDATALQVTNTNPSNGALIQLPLTSVTVDFSEAIDPASVAASDLEVSQGTVTGVTQVDADTLQFTFSGLLEGPFHVNLKAGAILDQFGFPVEFFSASYSLDVGTVSFPTPLTPVAPYGSLVYEGSTPGLINAAGDVDSFTIDLEAGMKLTTIVTPDSALRPRLQIFAPGGTSVGTSSPSAAGMEAIVSGVVISTAGTYTIRVSESGSTTGTYDLQVLLNAALESESHGGSDNGDPTVAQSLSASFRSVSTGNVAAALGTLDGDFALLPTEVEPNDDLSTASSAVGNFRTYTGNLFQMGISADIQVANDVDFFNIGQLQVGDVLTVSMAAAGAGRGTNNDTVVELWRANSGSAVTQDDDGGPPSPNGFNDSLIYRFSIATADTYFIRARGFSSSRTGTYQLGVLLENSGATPNTGTVVTTEFENNDTMATANNASSAWRGVQYQSSTLGNAGGSDIDTFEYQFEAGDLVTIDAVSINVADLQLALLDASGNPLAAEDGSSFGPGGSSLIYGYVIPTSGSYFVQVQPNFSTGSYRLDVDLSSNTVPPGPSSVYDTYAFNLQAGQHVTVLAEALSAGNIALQLVNSNNVQLATGTASATNVDQTIVDFVAPTTGLYFAQVSGSQKSLYNLVVMRGLTFDLEPNNTFGSPQIPTLAIPVLGAADGDDDWYAVQLTAGDVVNITTTTPGDGPGEFINTFDPKIEVRDSTGLLVDSDDNSQPDGRNAGLTFTALTTGLHRIRVIGAGTVPGTDRGEYTLLAALVPQVSLSLSANPFLESGIGTLTARLSVLSELDTQVDLAYTGTALFGTDYTAATSILIPAGQISASIPLTGIDDPRDENDETIIVDITAVTHALEQGVQQVTATIQDDDPTPTLTLTVDQTVITEIGGTAIVTVTSSAISDLDITVNLALTGSAILGTDYSLAPISLLISAGQLSVTAQISTIDDSLPEAPPETIVVDISSATNGVEATPQQVTIIIADDDHDPVAGSDFLTLAEGGTSSVLNGNVVSVITNDADGDLPYDLLTIQTTPVSGPAHGSVLLRADGTFTYTHDGGETSSDQFSYRLLDANGGLTSVGTVFITITPVNDNFPNAATDFINVNEGGQATSLIGGATSLLANDSDIDVPDTLTFDPVAYALPTHGTLTMNANGTFRYIHDGGETTSDSFQYRLTDAAGHTSIGTVQISINPINDDPVARPDSIEVLEGGTVTTLLNGANTILVNDSDAESPNSALTLTYTQPAHGTLTVYSDGTFSYQHDGSETQSDSFNYQIQDPAPNNAIGQTTVSIRILPVNDSVPVAVNDNAEVAQGGTIFTMIGGAVSVAANDTDADRPFDSFTVTKLTDPAHGTLTLASDGSFIYTHDGTKTATDSFTYTLTDAVGHSTITPATVNIAVRLINEKPTANAGGPYLVAPGTDLVLNGAGSTDPDGDTPLTYRWDIKGDGVADVVTTSPTATVPWATLVSLGLVSGATTVKLEVRDPSGLSSQSSTTLSIGSEYTFSPTADGVADDYVISTIGGALDIRKVGTSTNLAPAGLTAITSVKIVGSSDDETFTVQTPSRSLSFTIDGNDGNDLIKVQGTASADTFNIASTAGPNSRLLITKTNMVPFYVSATAETVALFGGAGNDTLDARQVTAALTLLQLFGDVGNDTLTGGLGNDSFVGGDGTDLLSEVGPGNLVLTDSQLTGHGTDTIDTTIEAIKLTGDGGNNLLDASAFTRFGVLLDGAAGDDTLLGGTKTDSLIGGTGIDEVRQAVSGNATLTNLLLVLGTSPNTVSDGLSGIEKAKLTGSTAANKLDATSFSGSVTLDGGAGNDTLIGGAGADLLLGGADKDSLLGNAGNDTIGGGTGNDIIDGGDGNDGIAGGDGNDTIKGGNGNDTLLGQAGDDSLRGGAGRDLIQGGLGKDNINGEGDTDTVMGGSGGGADLGDKIFDPVGEVIEGFRFSLDWLSLI